MTPSSLDSSRLWSSAGFCELLLFSYHTSHSLNALWYFSRHIQRLISSLVIIYQLWHSSSPSFHFSVYAFFCYNPHWLRFNPAIANLNRMACGFSGNPDIYGIGIRVGYYSQALAVWFANYFHYREANGLRSVNNLFLFALTIVGLTYVHNARQTYAVEAFLLLYIAVVIAVVSLLDTTRFTSRYMKVSRDRMLVQSIIFHGGFIFAIFFWWKGLDEMRPTPCERLRGNATSAGSQMAATRGDTYASYLVRANMYGWMRTVMQVLSLWGLVWSVLVVNSSAPLEIMHSLLRKKSKVAFMEAARSLARGINTSNHSVITGLSPESADHNSVTTGAPVPQDSHVGESPNISNPNDSPSSVNGSSEEERTEEVNASTVGSDEELIFSAVQEAELYLNTLFTECQTPKALLGRKRVVIWWRGYMRFYIPNRKSSVNTNLTPLSDCLYMIFTWSTWGIISLHLRWRLHLHLVGLAQGPLLIWPRILHRAYQFAEKTKPPDWRDVAIASDVQLHQIPLKKATGLWVFSAVHHLLLIIILIVQVELTIVWNHIHGLNSLTSLGQLIAFILGVGGLLKVLWGKWRLVRQGIKDEIGLHRTPDDYEAAMDTYIQWKAMQPSQLNTQAEEQTEPTQLSGSPPADATASTDTHAT